jgi:hypothetical protein
VGHLPLHPLPPGLLPYPAAAAAAVDQLERGQVAGVVDQLHEAAGTEQGQDPSIVLVLAAPRAAA